MAHLTIGEVARQTELTPSTLRYYEQIGLLTPPPRERGRRRYDRDTVAQVAAIKLAQRAGFTLAEIRELLHGFPADTPPSARWQAMARRKVAEIDALRRRAEEMQRVLEAGLQCGCEQLSACRLCEQLAGEGGR